MLDRPPDRRCRNFSWTIRTDEHHTSMEGAQLAVLMDIRDELQAIRRRLDCPSALAIPRYLEAIERNTRKAKRKRKAVK